MFLLNTNKKGQVTQVLLFMIMIVILAFTVVFIKFFLGQFWSAWDSSGASTPATLEIEAGTNEAFMSFDYAIVFLAIGLIIGMIFTSFLIPSHPIFFIVNIIGIFILIFFGMILTNIYGEMVAGEGSDEAGITTVAETYPKINYLIAYLPYISAVILGIMSIVMFAKGQGGGTY